MLAGHKIIWVNDFDKDALDTYVRNLNKIEQHEIVLGDITKLLNIEQKK